MTREEATQKILEAKKERGLTFAAIAEELGMSKEWTAATIFGQGTMNADEAARAVAVLGVDEEVGQALQEIPLKGSLAEAVPVDPLIYRFHEINQVYGTTFKALIHEMFGDGIMSAVDFTVSIEKVEDPKGDRVKVTYNGKFLPYRKW